MYAVIVKDQGNNWDVIAQINYSTDPIRQKRLSDAVDSGKPITGMITTQYKCLAMNGSVWDGITFTGGMPCVVSPELTWEGIETYSLLCDNIIVAGLIITANPVQKEMLDAAFSDPNNVTLIKVPDGVNVKIGDVWDGENFISR